MITQVSRMARTTGLAILALAMTACLGRSPSPEHYMLGTQASGPAGDAAPEIALLVGPVRLPAYLDRPQFARLEGQGEIELDEFARWLGGFEDNFLRALSLDLARRTGSIRIAASPSKAPFPFDARIRLHVDDFVVEGNVLRARIRWAVIPTAKGAAPVVDVMEAEFPVAGGGNRAIVAAHDAAVAALAERIVAALPN
ncbi:MAG: PqiC family protein [bacterium]|nr:PqiC family protein [bacterium]